MASAARSPGAGRSFVDFTGPVGNRVACSGAPKTLRAPTSRAGRRRRRRRRQTPCRTVRVWHRDLVLASGHPLFASRPHRFVCELRAEPASAGRMLPCYAPNAGISLINVNCDAQPVRLCLTPSTHHEIPAKAGIQRAPQRHQVARAPG